LAKKKWIQQVVPPSHKGLLHKALGVPVSENIPVETINKRIAELRAKSKSGPGLSVGESKMLKRLLFALNMRNMNKG
jgi:hypothetical protein